MNLYESLMPADLDRVFLVTDDGEWTFGEVDQRAGQLSAVLTEAGVERGDRVAAVVSKSQQAVCLYLACLRLGAVYLPLNPAYTAAEVQWFVSDADAAVLVCDSGRADTFTEFAGQVVTLTGPGSLWERCTQTSVPFVEAEDTDIAAMLYTSGTTGRSKGAMLSHGALRSNAEALVAAWRWDPADVLLHVLPIFHVHGLFVALHCAMLGGSKVLFRSRFGVDDTLAHLPLATVLMAVPTLYHRLTAHIDTGTVSHMRLFVSGSAPLRESTHQLFAERTGHMILERYGMTEAGMICSNPYDGDRVAGSVGFGVGDYTLRVVDTEGHLVELEEVGVLEVKGSSLFSGYWNLPEKTAGEFTPDGYFRTGDLAMIDNDGRVWLKGRNHDLIISGGFNVYPREVERSLSELQGVAEVAVVGLPDSDLGQVVGAAIVGTATESDLRAGVAEVLAPYKQPKRYWMTAEIPRNAMGKVQKNRLRDDWEAQLDS